MYLTHLSIAGFRGIGEQLELPLDHRTIIYGPNGSGKTSVLQAIAWTIYGKLPMLTGSVFTREDALVNDFLDEGNAEIKLFLSDGSTITRSRKKQTSTGRGRNPLTVSVESDDPQMDVEQIIGLSVEEFFAAVLLHQETIRDFITTTPEKRSATIDRMLGTYLLRTLVRVVDPKMPAKAIDEAKEGLERLDQQLSQASVITREVIQQRKKEYGDPAELPQLLTDIRQELMPAVHKLGLNAPEDTLIGLEESLDDARQSQLKTVRGLESKVGGLTALKERYHQAAVTSWQTIDQRKEQYGDPYDLPNILERIRRQLSPLAERLELAIPEATVGELEESLVAARQAQPRIIGRFEKSAGQLSALKERYQQVAVTSWQAINQRKQQYGDPDDLPIILERIQRDLSAISGILELAVPPTTDSALVDCLALARRAQPRIIGDLEKKAGRLSTLKERHDQLSREVIEDVSVPSQLENRRAEINAQINTLNQEIPTLTRQINQRRGIEKDLGELREKVRVIPELRDEIERVQERLDVLEAAGKAGTLYNQLLTPGQEYLEQVQPPHCPLCKQKIENLQTLLDALRQETPHDEKKMRQELKTARETLRKKQNELVQLGQSERRIEELEQELTEFPAGIESQIESKQKESAELTEKLTTVQAEIAKIEGRIKLAVEHRKRLDAVVRDIETALGQPPSEDVDGALDQTLGTIRERVAEIQALDFEPIAAELDQAKQIRQIEKDEAQLRQRLNEVLSEVEEELGHPPGDDVAGAIDQAIKAARERVAEIQALDFEPIAAELDQAKQIRQIEKDEAQLRQRLNEVLSEVEEELGHPPGDDVAGAIDQAIKAARERVAEVQAFDFQTIAGLLNRAKQLDEIRKDENRLRGFEDSYQTATQEKARLNNRIRRLTNLRNALQDIAETTKRHQRAIVSGVLGELDIHRYYQQLDPHPAYRHLQIEPEPTQRGTYNYWIKALTDDRVHDTYVQTRFSTAQANCAAVAIFLAVNQHLSRKLETVILDDPSQSMDPKHKEKLAQTLATIPRQVIVATEDAQTLDLLKKAFDSPTVHELGGWTVEGASLVL